MHCPACVALYASFCACFARALGAYVLVGFAYVTRALAYVLHMFSPYVIRHAVINVELHITARKAIPGDSVEQRSWLLIMSATSVSLQRYIGGSRSAPGTAAENKDPAPKPVANYRRTVLGVGLPAEALAAAGAAAGSGGHQAPAALCSATIALTTAAVAAKVMRLPCRWRRRARAREGRIATAAAAAAIGHGAIGQNGTQGGVGSGKRASLAGRRLAP